MTRLLRRALGAAHGVSLRSAARAFESAARDPERAQRAKLLATLRENAGTSYGRAHGFAGARGVEEYQDCVPVVDYDALAPWIERVAQGERDVLTAEPVRMLEESGGSTAATKLVPYTNGLLHEFAAATGPWLADLRRSKPALRGALAYWSVSPATRERRETSGGIPIGFADDTEYFGPIARWAIRRTLAVPPEIARIRDVDAWRSETARRLLLAEDLGLVSVWSPTFLTLLMREVERQWERRGHELRPSRRLAIERAIRARGRFTGEALWPRLALVSCWTDAAAADALPALRAFFPEVEVQGKGLLATEGVVTFPLFDAHAPVAAVASHFIEFSDLDRPDARPALVHELEAGRRYTPLLTTRGGLYRYHLKDEIVCVGHHERFPALPLLRFEGRVDGGSDLAGEKLAPALVQDALRRAREKADVACAFAMLAPSADGARYLLFVESAASDAALEGLASALDAILHESQPYRHVRRLGQLAPIRARRVRDAWRKVERRLAREGRRVGAIKPAAIDARGDWEDALA